MIPSTNLATQVITRTRRLMQLQITTALLNSEVPSTPPSVTATTPTWVFTSYHSANRKATLPRVALMLALPKPHTTAVTQHPTARIWLVYVASLLPFFLVDLISSTDILQRLRSIQGRRPTGSLLFHVQRDLGAKLCDQSRSIPWIEPLHYLRLLQLLSH